MPGLLVKQCYFPISRVCSKYFSSTRPLLVFKQSRKLRPVWTNNAKVETDTVFSNLVQKWNLKSLDDLSKFKSEIEQSAIRFSGNIDVAVLGSCTSLKKFDFAENYVELLKQKGGDIGIGIIGKYLHLLYLKAIETDNNAKDLDAILYWYQELKRKYKVLDAVTSDHVICALSLTKEWKTCLEILKDIKLTCSPTNLTYNSIIKAALRNGDKDTSWELLKEAAGNGAQITSDSYEAYFNQILSSDSSKSQAIEDMNKIFDFLSYYGLILNDSSAEVLSKLCKKLGMKHVHSNLSPRGICSGCNKLLSREQNQDEFAKLKDIILQKVLIGRDVFYKTDPEELARFKEFTSKMPKYDVVIDGLNVAYSGGVKQSGAVLSFLVHSVVSYFTSKNMKVLVLGRTHMRTWPRWKLVENIADTFLAQSLSQDDPYLLYCAVASGVNTMLVSKDLMRSHVFKIENPRSKVVFKQWLISHQYQLRFVENNGKVHFKLPLPYTVSVQNAGDYWHIPYQLTNNSDNVKDVEPIVKWMCICSPEQ